MELKEKKIAKRKEEILRSAVNIVVQKGLQKTTMEDIAAELLMTKGALYYYFKNKDDLIYQCHELILTDSIKSVREHTKDATSATEKLKKAIAVHVQFAVNEKDIYNLILKPQETFPEKYLTSILAKRKEYERIFDEIIYEGIESGEFNITEVKMARMMALGAMNWIQQWYSPQGSYTQQEIAEIYSEYLLKIFT
ncbi:MAG TPA: TetR/AcrR family transcriptional regulator [Bacilli bacterium]|nr:TetR/AcrR family transcriptional regulator [Bacilli bacterium]